MTTTTEQRLPTGTLPLSDTERRLLGLWTTMLPAVRMTHDAHGTLWCKAVDVGRAFGLDDEGTQLALTVLFPSMAEGPVGEAEVNQQGAYIMAAYHQANDVAKAFLDGVMEIARRAGTAVDTSTRKSLCMTLPTVHITLGNA